MIYYFEVTMKTKRGKEKKNTFYLSAQTLSEFYKRAHSQYNLSKDQIVILEEYDESKIKL